MWDKKWGLGGLDLQRKPNKSAEHALLYVTKYLTKYPDKGFPDWVLHLDRRIRWVGASKAVGRLVADREWVAGSSKAAESLPPGFRPLAMRMAECKRLVNFFLEVMRDGELHTEFFGRMPVEIMDAARCGARKLDVSEDDTDGSFLSGHWATFDELANQILNAANVSRRQWGSFTAKRYRRMREIGRSIRGEADDGNE